MTLFLDACIVIYWIEAPDPIHARLMAQLGNLRREHRGATFAVSRLSLLECLVVPVRGGDAATIEAYREFFEAGDLQIVELTAAVVWQATTLRATLGLRTPDALQAASALALEGRILFLTNDKAFRKVPGLELVLPG